MSFRLVQKSLTLNDFEWRNGQTGQDMAIFRFSKMAATAILDFQISRKKEDREIEETTGQKYNGLLACPIT